MTARRPRRRPGENRERLREAGLVEFGLFGYHGASTSSIAARADVPQPHVYASFATKQALFLACWERVYDAVLQKLGAVDALEAAFFYQAVALVRERELGETLRPDLLELRTVLGEQRLGEVLLAGGCALLDSEDSAPRTRLRADS